MTVLLLSGDITPRTRPPKGSCGTMPHPIGSGFDEGSMAAISATRSRLPSPVRLDRPMRAHRQTDRPAGLSCGPTTDGILPTATSSSVLTRSRTTDQLRHSITIWHSRVPCVVVPASSTQLSMRPRYRSSFWEAANTSNCLEALPRFSDCWTVFPRPTASHLLVLFELSCRRTSSEFPRGWRSRRQTK
jgi:hypothetical protein